MTDLRQAAQAVVDRWDSPKWEWSQQGPTADLMAALRTALEQQAEPVAREAFEKWAKFAAPYMDISRFGAGYSDCNTDYAWAGWQAAQRPWQGLTDEKITELRLKTFNAVATNYESYRAIEAKLRSKNNE